MFRIVIILLFCFITKTIDAQKHTERDNLLYILDTLGDASKQCSVFNLLSSSYLEEDNKKVYSYAQQAVVCAEKSNNQAEMAAAYKLLYYYHSDVGQKIEALDYLLKSQVLFEAVGNKKQSSFILNNLGLFYKEDRVYDKAVDYFIQCTKLMKEHDFRTHLYKVYTNIAITYSEMKAYNDALKYLNLAVEECRRQNKQVSALINNTFGSVYLKLEQNDKALTYFEQAITFNGNEHRLGCAKAFLEIGKIQIIKDQYDKAFESLKKAKSIINSLNTINERTTLELYLFQLEAAKKNHRKATEHFNTYTILKDSLFDLKKYEITQKMKLEFDVERKEKAILLLEKENLIQMQQQKVSIAMLIIIAFLLGSIGLRYYYSLQLMKKEKQVVITKEALTNSEKIMLQKEKEKIERELKFKQKELTNFALHLTQKNEFLEVIEKELNGFKFNSKDNAKLRGLLFELRQRNIAEHELDSFQKRAEVLNSQFRQHLIEKFPTLSKNEVRLVIFLNIGLSSKEIATINQVSEGAVKMARHRLRKKLNLDSAIDLADFFR